MYEIFKDPVWQFIGAILGLLAIITSVLLYFFQRKNKMLSYDIVYDNKILSSQKRFIKDLEILFQGKQVDNIHLLVLKLSNTGNVPIVSNDYEKNIEFYFGESITILSAEVRRTEPKKISPVIQNIDNKIIIEPLLLNPKDSISIEVIITGENYSIEVNSRIIGVNCINRGLDIIPMKTSVFSGYILIGIGIIIFLIGIINTGFKSEIEKYVGPGVAAIISGFYILLFRSFLRPEKYGLMLMELVRTIKKHQRSKSKA